MPLLLPIALRPFQFGIGFVRCYSSNYASKWDIRTSKSFENTGDRVVDSVKFY